MNAALILSGGSGKRFESDLPKQYHEIDGKMVIAYVLDAVAASRAIDRTLIAAAPSERLFALQPFYGFDWTNGGAERNQSLGNGLKWIAEHERCDKIIVLDAVRPMVSGSLIARYMRLLDDWDAVSTAQRITDSLGCLDIKQVDRSRYYLMQSPEAFRFPLLHTHFNPESKWTEVVSQLPDESRVYLNYDFPSNLKLTYPWEKDYIALALRKRGDQ